MDQVAHLLLQKTGELLFAARTNYGRRNLFHIHKSIEKFCAGQMGKMDDVFGNLFDSPANFLPRIQAQLEALARAGLENAEDGRVRLEIDFVLGGDTGTDGCDKEPE